MATFELIGSLSITFGIEIFTRSLEGIFFQYLTNTAASVREMGVKQVKSMATSFGVEWITTTLIPKVVESYNVEQ